MGHESNQSSQRTRIACHSRSSDHGHIVGTKEWGGNKEVHQQAELSSHDDIWHP